MSRVATAAAYPTITSVGALLPPDLLRRAAAGTLDGMAPGDYGLPDGFGLRQAAARAWELLLPTYRSFQQRLAALPNGEPATVLTRDRWTTVLLRELGYDLTDITGIVIEDDIFDVRHIDGHVPVHLLGWNVELDKRARTNVRGASRTAPHSMIQEMLNRTDDHLWAVLSNGKRLRLLRDNHTLGRASYIEFDLEGMFGGEQFADFAIMYVLVHASRLRSDKPVDCWLEKWRTTAITDGTRALQDLRVGVKNALETLGTGFLEHPDNRALRDLIADNPGATSDYYRWLLRVVYRLIFLMVAEDREVLHAEDVPAAARNWYQDYFSVSRLRRLATRRRAGRHHDLWATQRLVFAALGDEGQSSLGLPAYGSFLFSEGAVGLLHNSNISNARLLDAIRYLSQIVDRESGVQRAVDYKNLGAEELGSVYEALLAYVPTVAEDGITFSSEILAGNARKTSGAYYTPTELVEVVLDESLDPLLDEASKSEDPVAAILALTVCDPACGSGHFLVAAARRIARRLAIAMTGDPEPSAQATREAMRLVVAHCIYGVDLNDLAAELAKISLWLEALTPGKPLAFLDAHIKVGNALLGATPALLARNVPDEAFNPLAQDDRSYASSVKKHNKRERERISDDQTSLWSGEAHDILVSNTAFSHAFDEVEAVEADSIDDLRKQADAWRRAEADPDLQRARLVADAWCAAFVWPLNPADEDFVEPITHRTLVTLQNQPDLVPLRQRRHMLSALSRRNRFFHWHLEFPQVFHVPDSLTSAENPAGWNGGFSLVLGNPPWDTLSPDRREFFGQFVEGIRGMSKDEQDKAIDNLMAEPAMAAAWSTYERDLLATVHFLKNSRRYTLYAAGNLGKGDFNVYRNFVEQALRTIRPGGYAAQVVPGGLYGGANASAIRRHLVHEMDWRILIGCINTGGKWFPDADVDRFCAYSARKVEPTSQLDVAFGLASPATVKQDIAKVRIGVPLSTVIENNPDTFAISDIRDPDQARITFSMYRAAPAFGKAIQGSPLRVYQREIDMGNDRDLLVEGHIGLPVFEGRMIDQYDYRAKKYLSGHGNNSRWEETPFGHVDKGIHPQWRVLRADVPNKVRERAERYRVGFGDVANPRNERSLVATIIPPKTICGHTVPTFVFKEGEEWAYFVFLAVANTLSMDFLARQRLTSIHMSYTVLDSLPIPRLHRDDPLTAELVRRVLRLICTGPEMNALWDQAADEGWVPHRTDGTPGATDRTTRERLRSEIEVLVARDAYGLSVEDLSAIAATFPVLERRERREWGEFRTQRLLQEKFAVLPRVEGRGAYVNGKAGSVV
jgi:hypothetical protein